MCHAYTNLLSYLSALQRPLRFKGNVNAGELALIGTVNYMHATLFLCSYIYIYICYSYTMDTSGLPDMYTRSPRAEGVHIRQTTSGHGITDMYHSHSLW